MKFEAIWSCYSTRYWGGVIGLVMILLFILLRPIFEDRITSAILFKAMFLRDIKITGLLIGICLYGQIVCYFCSNKLAKLIIVDEDKTVIHLFSGKVFEFKYSNLSSLEFTDGLFELFLFTFKDGTKQKISSSVKNHKLAFEIIRKKILETKQTRTS